MAAIVPPKEQERPAPPRLDALDAARGVGILLVVLAHAGLLGGVGRWVFSFYMPLFFVISGYLYGKRPASTPAACARRAGRLAKEYFVTCAVLAGLWLVLFGVRGRLALVPRILFSVLYGRFSDPANPLLADECWTGQLWFFTLMVSASALYALVRPLDGAGIAAPGRLTRHAGLAALLLGAAQLFRLCPVLLPWCLDTAPMGALLLLAGSWLADADWLDKPLAPGRIALLAACGALFFGLQDTYDLHMRGYGRLAGPLGPLCFFAVGFAGSLLLLSLCRSAVRGGRLAAPLLAAGRNSLPIFEYHILGLFLLKQLLARLSLPAPLYTALLAVGCFAVAFVCVVLRAGFDRRRAARGKV